MYITREKAVDVLYNIINSGVIDNRLIEDLAEIAMCIGHESDGLHLWGAEDDVSKIFTAYRVDLITEEMQKEHEEIYANHAFVPAPYEAEYFNDEEEDEEEDENC